ncbi:hypothetical protein F4824DRAFT_273317 [Ustulina deusta]|nr:hypothetical protein F4824DRAFT_273317 [Ustulina deusta]
MEEETATTPLPATLEAISRPSSASPTTASAATAQLPGIVTTGAMDSPELKAASTPAPVSTPTPPTAQTQIQAPAQEPQSQSPSHSQAQTQTQAQAEAPAPPTITTATAPITTLTPTPTPMHYTAYAQTATPTPTTAPTSTTPATAPPAPAPMPAPMQMPIVAPIAVTMNNHIASSPAAHAPTPSGNLVRTEVGQLHILVVLLSRTFHRALSEPLHIPHALSRPHHSIPSLFLIRPIFAIRWLMLVST